MRPCVASSTVLADGEAGLNPPVPPLGDDGYVTVPDAPGFGIELDLFEVRLGMNWSRE